MDRGEEFMQAAMLESLQQSESQDRRDDFRPFTKCHVVMGRKGNIYASCNMLCSTHCRVFLLHGGCKHSIYVLISGAVSDAIEYLEAIHFCN